MFLFLILIVDVRVENTQKFIFSNKEFLFSTIFSIFFSTIFSIVFINNYCPLLANNISFYLFFNEAEVCKCLQYSYEFYHYDGSIVTLANNDWPANLEFMYDSKALEGKLYKKTLKNHFYTNDFVLDSLFGNLSFDEITILGVTFFEQHGMLLVLIGLFLLIATIVAVILCLNIFN
jgi:hypothetical protein